MVWRKEPVISPIPLEKYFFRSKETSFAFFFFYFWAFESVVLSLNYHPIEQESIYQEWIDKINPNLIVIDVRENLNAIDLLVRFDSQDKSKWLSQKFVIELDNLEKPNVLRHVSIVQIRDPQERNFVEFYKISYNLASHKFLHEGAKSVHITSDTTRLFFPKMRTRGGKYLHW